MNGWIAYVLASHGFGVLFTVALIGQRRKTYTTKDAVIAFITFCIVVAIAVVTA